MQDGKSRGFTLIELSMLMVVFGIVAATVVAGTANLIRAHRVTGVTNTLLGDLRYARTLAATQRSEFQVRFQAGEYSIVRVSPLQTTLTRTCPPGVSFYASNTARFYPWGLVTPATISIDGCGGSRVLQLSASGNVTHE
jgi:prepilin-type N-terminal cleavage/methylation domain-containing protein